jgi:hypothetical protein
MISARENHNTSSVDDATKVRSSSAGRGLDTSERGYYAVMVFQATRGPKSGRILRLLPAALVFFLLAGSGMAGTVLFSGTFSQDDDVALFTITANTSESITIETYSYAGGTVDANVFPAGGFAPTAFLFDNLGDVLTISNGSCGQVGTDPTTGNCDDLFFQDTLGPGTYTLALAVYNNTPVDTAVADGFVEDGNPGFTCVEAGVSGSFCDLTTALGTSRTGNYAITITGADSVELSGVPEPGSMFLVLSGGALALLRRRFFKFRAR